ncbi:MAG: hypothetical protein EAZ92_09625 [Candidatus Kapaibacterium sp.]|nr:MAG: hypothetical protein EAZ92_09625 [Candidatus Kapabacteria bacterium]
MPKQAGSDYEQFAPASRAEWRLWLEQFHTEKQGIWLVYFKKESGKKESGKPRVSYDDAVEEALCFGWIDSVVRTLDEASYQQLFTPRKKSSNWSRLNKERVQRLVEQGLMHEAGQRMIDIAKASGKWDALNDVENLTVPEDLQALFDENPDAARHWNTFSRSSKRGILEWILNAKRPETRLKRLHETVRMAAKNLRVNFDKE